MIVFGIIALGLTLVISLMRLALWPAVPLLPLAGLMLMLSIGAPWKLV